MDQGTQDKRSWLSLASPIIEGQSTEEVLKNANADYSVFLEPVQVWDKLSNSVVTVPHRFVTCRENPNGLHCDSWEVVKERYEVVQNSDILKRAEDIVSRASDKAKLHSCGVLDNGRKFFVAISFGSISLAVGEPSDSKSFIDCFLVVMSSHDGSIPICYYNLDVDRTRNTVYRFSSNTYDFDLRKRHTTNIKGHEVEASEAIELRKGWTAALLDAIKALEKPIGTSLQESTMNVVASLETANTKKKREHAENVHSKIEEIFRKQYNSGKYGESRWSFYNAVIEYIDFYRDIDPLDAAQHTLEIDNYSHRLKVQVFDALVKQ
jgi:hypothetical protein